MCPKRPNAPTSAAAFAHRLSSQRSSPSCTIGIYPIGYRPSGSAPLQRQHCTSGRIAPVSSVTELWEPPRAQKCRLCARNARKWGSEGKNAQKPRFCAQNARKQGFQTPKTHKNADFVLERRKNQGKIASSDTKMPILCSKCLKTWVPEAKKAQKPRFCAREEGDWHQGERKLASGSITAETLTVNLAFLQITAHVSKTQIPHNKIINF